jgi:hypothetical protein
VAFTVSLVELYATARAQEPIQIKPLTDTNAGIVRPARAILEAVFEIVQSKQRGEEIGFEDGLAIFVNAFSRR